MAQSIGIDFGTAYLTAAVWDEQTGEGRVLARMPAVARMLHGGGALCGEAAHEARSAYALSTVDQIKRFLGRTPEEVRGVANQVAWNVQQHPDRAQEVLVDAWTGQFSPEEIAAELLKTLASRAARALGEPLGGVVITVPAAAHNRQRLALKAAAERAGLQVRRIVNEPTALALAEAHAAPPKTDGEPWAVIGFGAGMTDIAIVRVSARGVSVAGVAGDTQLGLGEIRAGLIERLEARFRERHRVPIDRTRTEVRAELLWLGEEFLHELARRPEHRADLRNAAVNAAGAMVDLDEQLTACDLEAACRPALERLEDLARSALKQAEVKPRAIERVILAGGGAYLPPIRQAVARIFKRPLAPAPAGVEPHERPARGVALLAAALDGRVVLRLQDILAQSLGITLVHDRFSKLLEAGQALPVLRTGNYSTVEDFQDHIRFEVREGELPKASRNALLGCFTLAGIRRAPRGVPEIQVSFRIDESGVLHVEAVDRDTRSRQQVLIERTRPA